MNYQKIKLTMVREKSCTYNSRKITSPTDIVQAINEIEDWYNFPFEKAIGIALNSKNQILNYYDVAQGGANNCPIDIKAVVTPLLLSGANKLILVHNHPSGDPTPSHDDFMVTKKVKEACDLLGIDLLDHIVIATNGISHAM